MSPNSDFVDETIPRECIEPGAVELRHSSAVLKICALTKGRGMRRRDFLGSAAAGAGMLVWPGLRLAASQIQATLEPGQRQKIEAAIPTKAFIPPRRHRKLLIFDLNVGYGGHRSIATCNLAFTHGAQKPALLRQ